MQRYTASFLSVAVCTASIGCAAYGPPQIDAIRVAYGRGDYAEASRQAQQMMRVGPVAYKDEAAYMAGMSAYRLKATATAERHLQAAAKSSDVALSADALIVLGLIYAQQGKHAAAVRSLLDAVPRLPTGQDRANAYFHAAKAQQKLGQWGQARTSLRLARGSSTDPAFRKRAIQELSVTGFTIQVGAFANQANALRTARKLARKVAAKKLGLFRLVPAVDQNGQAMFLVQAGKYSSHDSANSARDRLGLTSAIIVPLAVAGRVHH